MNQHYPWTTAESLRAFKAATHLTDIQVADVLGVSKQSVRRWLTANRMPVHIVKRLDAAAADHQPDPETAPPATVTEEPRLFIFQGYVCNPADLVTITKIIEALGGNVTPLWTPAAEWRASQ